MHRSRATSPFFFIFLISFCLPCACGKGLTRYNVAWNKAIYGDHGASGLSIYSEHRTPYMIAAHGTVSDEIHRSKINGDGESEPDGVKRIVSASIDLNRRIWGWSMFDHIEQYRRIDTQFYGGIGYTVAMHLGSEDIEVLNYDIPSPDAEAVSGVNLSVTALQHLSHALTSVQVRWYPPKAVRVVFAFGFSIKPSH